MIEVKELTRRYGATLALDKVSFTVGAGEVVGFLGPNGAGKSTTMKILTGSLAPTSGTATVAGYDILDDSLGVRSRVGFMPEHVALYTDQSVISLLEFVAELKGVAEAEKSDHLAGLITATGLDEVREKLVGNLSHGFRKRVGLAQALVGDPEVLVLDEPTSGLDPHQIVEIRELIKGFRGRRTVLLSSHILTEVATICERVLIMDKGRLVGEEAAAGLAGLAAGAAPVLADGHRVVLTWEGDREGVARALAEVSGVDAVTITEDGAEVIIAGNPVEIRPRLVESVIQAGGRLQNISDRGNSLEDLFLRLTGAGPGKPPEDTDGDEP